MQTLKDMPEDHEIDAEGSFEEVADRVLDEFN
jgi:hypothetical protein